MNIYPGQNWIGVGLPVEIQYWAELCKEIAKYVSLPCPFLSAFIKQEHAIISSMMRENSLLILHNNGFCESSTQILANIDVFHWPHKCDQVKQFIQHIIQVLLIILLTVVICNTWITNRECNPNIELRVSNADHLFSPILSLRHP